MDDLSYTIPEMIDRLRHRVAVGAALAALAFVFAGLLRFA